MIVNISPHRSATQSVTAFAQAYGLAARHWLGAEFDAAASSLWPDVTALWRLARPCLDGAAIVSDLPWPLLYAQAAADDPDARFLLIQREPEAWLASVRRHTAGRHLGYLEKWFYATHTGQRKDRLCDLSDEALLAAVKLHRYQARDVLGERLTVLQLADPHLSERLAEMLGVRMRQPLGQIR